MLNLALEFQKKDIHVEFFVFSNSANNINEEFSVHVPPAGWGGRIFNLLRIIRSGKFDAVISAKEQANFLVKIATIFCGKFKPIYTRHSALESTDKSIPVFFLRIFFNFYLLGRGDIVTVSRHIKQSILRSQIFGRNRIVFLPNPVVSNELYFKSTENSDGINIEGDYICAVGRLCYEKGFDLLIDAYKKIVDRNSVVPKLIIAGEGDLREALQKKIANLNLNEKVILIGFTRNPYFLMKNSLVFVLSSRYEGLPTVLVEAIALNVPVVAFDCPTGPREIIKTGSGGELVENGDVSGLADAITRQITNKKVINTADISSFYSGASADKYIKLIGD